MTQWWSASIVKKMGVLAATSTAFPKHCCDPPLGWRPWSPRSVPLYEKTWVGEMMNWGSKLPIYNQTKLVSLSAGPSMFLMNDMNEIASL